MRITHKGHTFHLDQCVYLQKIVECCGMLNTKSTSTPLPAGYYATKNTESVDVELRSHFQMVIGSLLYLMLGTRPNIAFAVTHLSCHAANPSQDHLNKALYICRYLIGMSTASWAGLTAASWHLFPLHWIYLVVIYVLHFISGPVSNFTGIAIMHTLWNSCSS